MQISVLGKISIRGQSKMEVGYPLEAGKPGERLKLFFLKDKHIIVILYNSCPVKCLLLSSFDQLPVANSKYIVSHVSLTMYIL